MNFTQALRSKAGNIALIAPVLAAAGFIAQSVFEAPAASASTTTSRSGASPNEVEVSTTAQLIEAIRSAKAAKTIRLSPGEYGPLTLNGVMPAQEVIITSRDPSRPAVLRDANVRNGGNLTFRDLVFKASGKAPHDAFLFQGARNLKFERLVVSGKDGPITRSDKLIFLRDSEHVSIVASEFTHGWIAVSLLDTRDVSIKSNYFHGLEMDGVRGGGNSSIEISYNYFTDFETVPPDHPDAIQFWTTRQTESARDITIVGNVITRGTGRAVQGIFMNDEVRSLPYQNVRIEDNIVVGAMYHGITVANATGMVLANNTVAAYPDQKSWIRAGGQPELRNNRAPIYVVDGKRVMNPAGNKVTNATTDQGVRAIREWAQGRSLDPYHASVRDMVVKLR